jgi:hypothetical protein
MTDFASCSQGKQLLTPVKTMRWPSPRMCRAFDSRARHFAHVTVVSQFFGNMAASDSDALQTE